MKSIDFSQDEIALLINIIENVPVTVTLQNAEQSLKRLVGLRKKLVDAAVTPVPQVPVPTPSPEVPPLPDDNPLPPGHNKGDNDGKK